MTADNQTKPRTSLITKIVYWIATGLMLALLGFAAQMYLRNHEMAAGFFTFLGFPTYIVYPLAVLKIIAIIVVVTHRWNDLRDMVYAAYFINMSLALVAHLTHGDAAIHAWVGMVAIPVSYLLGNQVRGMPKRNFFGRFTHPGK